MPIPYKIEVSRTVNSELYTTDKDVNGPADLEEFLQAEGSAGVFNRAIKDWKREQSILLSSKLKAAVDPDSKPKKAAAKRVDL